MLNSIGQEQGELYYRVCYVKISAEIAKGSNFAEISGLKEQERSEVIKGISKISDRKSFNKVIFKYIKSRLEEKLESYEFMQALQIDFKELVCGTESSSLGRLNILWKELSEMLVFYGVSKQKDLSHRDTLKSVEDIEGSPGSGGGSSRINILRKNIEQQIARYKYLKSGYDKQVLYIELLSKQSSLKKAFFKEMRKLLSNKINDKEKELDIVINELKLLEDSIYLIIKENAKEKIEKIKKLVYMNIKKVIVGFKFISDAGIEQLFPLYFKSKRCRVNSL